MRITAVYCRWAQSYLLLSHSVTHLNEQFNSCVGSWLTCNWVTGGLSTQQSAQF